MAKKIDDSQKVVQRTDDRLKGKEEQVKKFKSLIKEAITEAKETGEVDYSEKLGELVDLLEQGGQADCFTLVFDQCTLEIPENSLITSPPIFVNVLNDPFFLQCCVTPTQVSASTPCGDIEDAATVNEVRATGYINYYLAFQLGTFFSEGPNNCFAVNSLPFSCTGTTCVDDVICYTSLNNEDPCPDFCNGNVQSFALRCSTCTTNNKLTVTYAVIHLLPNCE